MYIELYYNDQCLHISLLLSFLMLQEQEYPPLEDILQRSARRIPIFQIFQLSRQGKCYLWVDLAQCTIHGEGMYMKSLINY